MQRVTGLGIVLLLLVAACTAGDADVDARRVRGTPVPTPAPEETPVPRVQTASVGLERFDGCRTLLEHLRAEAVDRVTAYGLPGQTFGDIATLDGRALAEPQAAEATGDSAGAATSGSSAPSFSGTNIQELGVDEPDIVKTDGRRVVALARGVLHVLAVDGASLTRIGTVDLEGGHGRELLLAGDRALVLGNDHGLVEPTAESPEILPRGQRSIVTVVDLRGPEIVSTLHLEGDYVSARLSEGIARIVLRSGAGTNLPFEAPGEGTSEDEAMRHNREVVENATLTRWLPRYVVEGGDGPAETGALTDCATTYRPAGFSGLGLVTVVTLDPADPEPRESTSVLAEAEVVYASPGNLYVATTEWPQGPVPLPRPVPDAPTRAAPDDAASPVVQETEVHRFDITDPEIARYVASGTVPGRVLNQWSISEHDGHLRVATTLDDVTGRDDSESRVTVLATRDGALVEVGSVGGLGRTERIYAVRFMGDVGYVVTFRQIDPLYVLDLSDPAAPRTTGELKIPGYSAYLHPVGDGLLLGIGQDATEEGRPLGTQVSLFDVGDPTNPTRLHHVRIPDARSEVEHDHHAFLWWADARLAMVPVQAWGGSEPFQGALAYGVDRDGIAERARLSHAEHMEERRPGSPDGTEPGFYEPTAPIRRSLVIGDTLFTMSELGIEGADLGSLDERSWFAF